MKYLSEVLNKTFDTEEELVEAEEAYETKNKARKERAKEVEEALKKADAAKQHAHDLLVAFCKDYGSYHSTIDSKTLKDFIPTSFFDIFGF